jgi:hypothetical protein
MGSPLAQSQGVEPCRAGFSRLVYLSLSDDPLQGQRNAVHVGISNSNGFADSLRTSLRKGSPPALRQAGGLDHAFAWSFIYLVIAHA